MNTINTTDTINQGRIKVNDCIDHTVTGVTTGTAPGSLDFKSNSGLYDFSAQVNFPNTTEGGIIDGMWVTQDPVNPLKWNIAAGNYFVGGQPYSYAGGSVTLSSGPSGFVSAGRCDIIIATSAGVTTVAGSANSTTPKHNGWQESSQLPLAFIIVRAGASSTASPALSSKANMNFGGRSIASGDTPNDSMGGFVDDSAKMSINMGFGNYISSDFSYSFGGYNNVISGTSWAATFIPNSSIFGGSNCRIESALSRNNGILNSEFCTMTSAATSNILGSVSSNIVGTSLLATVSKGNIIASTSSNISGSCTSAAMFADQGSVIANSDQCSLIAGDTNRVYSGYQSHVFAGQAHLIENAYSSTTIGGYDFYTSGMTGGMVIGAQYSSMNTNNTGNLMLMAKHCSLINDANDSGIIVSEGAVLSGLSNNSLIIGGRNARLISSDFTNVFGQNNWSIDSDTSNVFGYFTTAVTSDFAFVSGYQNLSRASYAATMIGGSGNTIDTAVESAIIAGTNNSLKRNYSMMINCRSSSVTASTRNTFIGLSGFSATASIPDDSVVVQNLLITQGLYLDNLAVGSGSTTLNTKSGVYLVNTTTGAATVTLPSVSSLFDGYTINIKDSGGLAGTNNITIAGNGNNIDGLSSQTISNNYGSMTVHYSSTDGAWFII